MPLPSPQVRADESQPAVYESLTCVEFADDLADKQSGRHPLLPEDPVTRARARIWASWADKNISGLLENHCNNPGLLVFLCPRAPPVFFVDLDCTTEHSTDLLNSFKVRGSVSFISLSFSLVISPVHVFYKRQGAQEHPRTFISISPKIGGLMLDPYIGPYNQNLIP